MSTINGGHYQLRISLVRAATADGYDISNITLVFDQDAGDEKPKPDGDGFYTVKIDVPNAFDDDLDNSIDAILDWLVANDEFITEDSDLLGVVIKGGNRGGHGILRLWSPQYQR